MDETSRKRFERVLKAYGADPAGWPAEDRQVLAPFLGEMDQMAEDARAIDMALEAASKPELPADAVERLLARLEGEARILTLPSRRAAPGQVLRWTAALPLAASLALGIYLGAMGALDGFLPETVTGELAAGDEDNADLSGVSEAEDFAEEDVS
jgi:hypothetical protein